jgi:hypothetical protein
MHRPEMERARRLTLKAIAVPIVCEGGESFSGLGEEQIKSMWLKYIGVLQRGCLDEGPGVMGKNPLGFSAIDCRKNRPKNSDTGFPTRSGSGPTGGPRPSSHGLKSSFRMR